MVKLACYIQACDKMRDCTVILKFRNNKHYCINAKTSIHYNGYNNNILFYKMHIHVYCSHTWANILVNIIENDNWPELQGILMNVIANLRKVFRN